MQLFNLLSAIQNIPGIALAEAIIEVNWRVIALSLIILAVPFILLKLERRKNSKKELLLDRKIDLRKTILEGLKLTAAIFFILILQGFILQALGLLDNEIIVRVISAQQPLTLLLGAIALGPIGEELLFRGYLLKRIGVVPQAVLFAMFHYGYGSVSEILAALSVGVLFGLYVQKNKNIYPVILSHALYNSLAIIAVLWVA
ncbi:CPBP family intramembrane metalloprotease [Candidatus Micrarchaeota archaeon]|nr:CPBP family intramembrane metalloprotease [Candidatus Micrarchaeota archaeon]